MNRNRLITIFLSFFLLASFAFLIFLYFWDALIHPVIMAERDLPIFFYPSLKLWVETLQNGEFPLWNPYAFSGQPLMATLQAAVLYPPNGLFLLFPLPFAFNLTIALHFFLSGWFIYLLTRELGGSREAGVLSALSFALGGFLLSVHNVLSTLQSVSWTPLVLFFWLKALRRQSRGYLVLGSFSILVQFLGGGMEVFLITQALVLFLTLFPKTLLSDEPCAPLKWRILGWGAMMLLFLGLGAVQIFPFLELLYRSIRRGGFTYQQAVTWSLSFKNLLYFFLPDFFWRGKDYYLTDQNWLKSIYLGIIPFILALGYFLGKDRRKIFFALILLISLLLALGSSTPIYRFLYSLMPGFSLIRYPVKFFFLTNLFLCLLAGLGWDALSSRLKDDPEKKVPVCKKSSIALALILVGILLSLSLAQTPLNLWLERHFPISYDRPWAKNLHNIARFSFFALLASLFFAFLGDRKIPLKWARVFLSLLLGADLFLANWNYYVSVNSRTFHTPGPNLSLILNDPGRYRFLVHPDLFKVAVPQGDNETLVRVLLKECLYMDYPMIHRGFNATGFGVLTDRSYYDLVRVLETSPEVLTTDVLKLMNVKYLLWPGPLTGPAFKLLRQGETYLLAEEGKGRDPRVRPEFKAVTAHLYEYREVLPGGFLVPNYQVVKDEKEMRDLIMKKGFDPEKTVLLDEEPVFSPGTKGLPADTDGVQWLGYHMNTLRLRVWAPGRRMLILSETFFPGWEVWVDGQKGKICRANHAFRAIPLNPGVHQVLMAYEPLSVRLGAAVSVAFWVGLGILLLRFKRRKPEMA